MSKLLTIIGATGQQGGSIANFVLDDPELRKTYRVRGIARDVSNAAARALQSKGAELLSANLNDFSTLDGVMKGTNTLWAMTTPAFGPDAKERELGQGKAIADAAVKAGVQYIIFSTLPHVERISGGKYKKVAGFDAKAEVEDYIRTLPVKSAFFSPASFMQNFLKVMVPRPNPAEEGSYMIARLIKPTTRLPLIETSGDTGKYVGAILAEPEKYEGKVFCAATALYSMEEQARMISEKTGKKVVYKQISEEQMRSYVPVAYGETLIEMMKYQEEYGYYGADTEEKVRWAAENARGKVTTFEEFLSENPLPLS